MRIERSSFVSWPVRATESCAPKGAHLFRKPDIATESCAPKEAHLFGNPVTATASCALEVRDIFRQPDTATECCSSKEAHLFRNPVRATESCAVRSPRFVGIRCWFVVTKNKDTNYKDCPRKQKVSTDTFCVRGHIISYDFIE